MEPLVCSFLMKIIIIISPEHCGAVMYDIIAMVVAIDAATAETTVHTLFVSIFALCNYLGCSIISVLLCSCLMVLQVWLASQITLLIETATILRAVLMSLTCQRASRR